jgi:predicted TIM-barrel fold metal-dependent hydrolase
MIIDIHAHHPREDGFADRLIEKLPEAGIDKICLFSAGEMFGHAPNDEILAASRKYPDQILAFALIELGADTPDKIKRYAGEGYRGFKLMNPHASYDDDRFFPIFERMERTGLPVLAHTGIVMRVPGTPARRVNSNWMRPICLDAVLRSFPAMNIIGAHLGAPWHEEASMMARLHPNYYVDLTGAWWGGWRVNKAPDFFRYHFFWENAWDKVLFGTDILALNELVPSKQFHDRMIEALDLPQETVARIYGETAKRLLGL